MTVPPPPPAVKHLAREMDDVAREFYRRWSEDGVLATTRCERCAETRFPPRSHCGRCGASQVWVTLPATGRLHAFTTQEGALRFAAPWVLALAEVGDVTIPGVVEQPYESLHIGQEVGVAPHPEPDTGLTLVRFEPAGR